MGVMIYIEAKEIYKRMFLIILHINNAFLLFYVYEVCVYRMVCAKFFPPLMFVLFTIGVFIGTYNLLDTLSGTVFILIVMLFRSRD